MKEKRSIQWHIKPFINLSAPELWALLALRTEVFVVEQNCAYQEVDIHDKAAWHIMAYQGEALVAYARVLPKNTVYKEVSIGRVLVKENHRRQKLGRAIFEKALACAHAHYAGEVIKIQAQLYLENFYQSFGFKTISKPYLDVGILHVDMVRI